METWNCSSGSTACESTLGPLPNVYYNPAQSFADPRFSSAELWVPPGTHTLLVLMESPLACGGNNPQQPECYPTGNAAYMVVQGEAAPNCRT
jgi:hypothetical protein